MSGTVIQKLQLSSSNRKFQAIFASPNRYFTVNSRWVPLIRTYQRKLFLEQSFKFSSVAISMDLGRGKCMKQINSSAEFAGFASGKPKERKKTGLQDIISHIRFCWSMKLKLTLHSYNWRRSILHPSNVFNRQRITFTRRI